MKFTVVPEQTDVASATMLTAGVTLEVTAIVTVLLVATVVEVHAALLVITKEMASLFAGEVNV